MVSLFRSAALAALAVGFATGFSSARPDEKEKPKVKFELRRAETKPADGLTPAEVPGSKEKIYLHAKADVTNEDVASAAVGVDVAFNPSIDILFTKEGAKKVEKLSDGHLGKPLAVLIDGKVISAPVIKAKFSDKAQITGQFTKEEAEKIAKALGGK